MTRRFLIQKAILATFSKSTVQYPLAVVFSDGSSFQYLSGAPEIIIRYKTSRAEWRSILFDHIGFSECYVDSEIDIEGENALEKLLRMRYAIPTKKKFSHPLVWLITKIQAIRTNNRNPHVEYDNLLRHYGLPTEFFHYMCGELYGYTEGYYETGKETQNAAQFKKYDYICRKLCLKPGDSVVEVGTAWGTMALLAAKKYGARVTNYGLLPEQNRVFEARIKSLGLEDKIKNVVRNARVLGEEKEKYDKYVSLGVFEHAGYARYEEWLKNIADCLKSGGIGVMTFTGYSDERDLNYMVDKYIWRGCYLPRLGRVIELMGKYNLNIVDVENVRFFYADTMKVLRDKMHEHWDKFQEIDPQIFTEKFRRVWNLYYTAAIENFHGDQSTLHAFQLVFVKGRGDVYPRTRDFLYKEPSDTSEMKEYEAKI